MEKNCGDERWAVANSTENAAELREEEDDDDDEEALSLSDLPLIHQSRKEEMIPPRQNHTEEDFDFCSFSKESEMCAADEVFYQGQILPLRHSLSSISRSESMDHYYSARLISSRSSSISSHQSSTSGSSSATANYRPRLPPRNQFHSHPSPSPRLYKQGITTRHSVKKSSVWNILRLGLVTTPPEIAFQDLKTRCPSNNNSSSNCSNFGSRNSTSSNCSSISSTKKKKKARALLGGCKCSLDAVDTVATKVVIIKRSASESDVEAIHLRQENVEEIKPTKMTKKQAAKKLLSHHRTFEWLKQLSVEGNEDEA